MIAAIKQEENETALSLLPDRLKTLDSLSKDELQLEVITGLLAGNVFDWGAHKVVEYIREGNFSFQNAKEKLQRRPWLHDDVDAWLERCNGPAHELAVIFVDNSGGDIILGVFPFARCLLQRGTKVILAANSYPAINDVIFSELLILADRVADVCPIIKKALSDQRLIIMESGLGSPCINLRRVDATLAEEMKQADLVVLEGMGRSIHTNFNAEFICESIKLAVIKNPWLAAKFGGETFSVSFRYEQPK
eukprot:gene10735-11884_t